MSRTKEFEERIERFKSDELQQQKKSAATAFLRFLVFVVFIVSISFYSNTKHDVYLILVSASVLGFGFLIGRHRKINRRIAYYKRLQSINQQEINLYDLKFDGVHTGDAYRDPNHYFSGDLDVFGQHSIFQLINRTATKEGEQRLAERLQTTVSREELLARREGIQELSEDLDWRQKFQTISPSENNLDISGIKEWLNASTFYKGKNWLSFTAYLYLLIPIVLIVMMVMSLLPTNIGVGLLFFVAVLMGVYKKRIQQIKENTSNSLEELKKYLLLMKHMEAKQFQSPSLRVLTAKLNESGEASNEVAKLKNIFVYLEGSDNIFFFFIAHLLFAWDLQWMRALDHWKVKHKDHLMNWVDAVAEMDVNVSIAGFAYNNRDFVYPEISEADYFFKAKQLAHPLIHVDDRIGNDFEFGGNGQLILITGSNMSGKSTFMRTVGVNIVLAGLGAPVCAQSCELSVMRPYTSMRTNDSIEENTSSFYAELKRIQQLIKISERGEKVLFVLDEVLKGTNSKDRHDGAKALILQLTNKNMTGFVSTHDLELTKLEDEMSGALVNYSFNSNFENGQLHFDYKVNHGACQSFNASQLMKSIGIEFNA